MLQNPLPTLKQGAAARALLEVVWGVHFVLQSVNPVESLVYFHLYCTSDTGGAVQRVKCDAVTNQSRNLKVAVRRSKRADEVSSARLKNRTYLRNSYLQILIPPN